MKTSESPFIADWFVLSLRWLLLLALGFVLLSNDDGSISWGPYLVLGIGILWNVGFSVLAGLNMRLSYHRQLNVLFDFLLAMGLSLLLPRGGFEAVLAGLLPIFSAALYFEWQGALAITLLYLLFVVAYNVLFLSASLFSLIPFLLPILILGAIFGFLGYRLMNALRAQRKAMLQAREQKERAELEAKLQKQRAESQRLRAVYELSSTLTSTLSYQRVIESALGLAESALSPEMERGTNPLVGAVLLFREGYLYIAAEYHLNFADRNLEFEGESGVLKTLLEERISVHTRELFLDPELGRITAFRKCTSFYCLPLFTGVNVYGALILGHPDPQYFTTERREMLDILARQMSIALQNASLYQSLLQEKEQMAQAHEEARKKLARDLHDGPTQSVSAIVMRLGLLRRMFERDPQQAIEELKKLEELAQRTVKEMRHMLFTLRPLVLETQGLKAALQSMADKMRETFNQEVIVEVDESVLERLEMGKQGVIFSLAEEAVNNARKHARAPHIWVRLRPVHTDILLFEVQDDGVGFDVKSVMQSYEKRGSLGMVNLTERAEMLNGLFNIISAPGKGTRVQVFIPLTEEAADRLHHQR